VPSSTKPRADEAINKKITAVPLLDLHRQYATIHQEITHAIERVCASQQFILGEEVEALESEIARFTGSSAAVGCASGTDALWLALTAAGIGSGDAVITTPFSFFASASAIVRVGARPIFVDVEHRTLNLDPSQVDAKLRSSPSVAIKAILPVHLYGQCADMTALRKISQEFQLPIIEDAAQALGAAWQNKQAGALGLAAAFSFYPTKNLSAYGEAGIVTTSSTEMAEHMRRLRNHGTSRRYHHEEFGWNARMDAIQAAILRVKLPHLAEWNQQRRDHAATYDRLFAEAGLISSIASEKTRVQPLENTKQGIHVFHQYVIRAQGRDELREFLAKNNIGTEVYYPVPLHLQPCFAYLGYREGDLPVAEGAANEVLALPMFPELTEDEQRCVVSNVADFYS
jgi:dTDP-4-amino-4,6-dideoxygalactose transaminase